MLPATGPKKVTSEQTHIVKIFSFADKIQYNDCTFSLELALLASSCTDTQGAVSEERFARSQGSGSGSSDFIVVGRSRASRAARSISLLLA